MWLTAVFRRAVAIVLAALVAMQYPAVAAPDSQGTDFWLAFPTNYYETPELRLFLGSATATSGRVSVPGIGFEASFSTTPGQVTTVALPSATQLSTTDGVQARGIHVEASGEVSVYGLNRIRYTTDAYLGLPTDVLGSEYVVMSHPGLSGYGSELAVVAPSDDTTVTIVPSVSLGSRPAGVPYTVALRRGDAYQLRAPGNQDLTGTVITATRPVAAFGAVNCANVPVGYYYCDHLVEQLPPVTTWGTNFATMPLASRSAGDTFRFLARQDGTEVVVNGERVATLGRGQVHQRILSGPAHVVSTKPVLVAQFSNGSTFDNTVSDPFMMLVPPYEQFLSRYTVATPASGFTTHYVNLVAPTSAVGAIAVDGVRVPASAFVAIGTSGFSGAQVPIATGSHTLAGPTPFGAFVYGFASYDSYGYPAGMSFHRLDPVASRFGLRRSAGWANDPVNTGTGNFVQPATDLGFADAVWGLEVSRVYNALDDTVGPLGRGWSVSGRSWLTEDVDGTVWLHATDGRVVAFTPSGAGYTRPEEVFGELRRDPDASVSLHHFDGSVDDFDPAGRLAERRRWDGQVVRFAHDGEGRLVEAAHTAGASVGFAYDGDRLVSATAGDGRTVGYAYDAEGDLAAVTDPAGGVTRYETDERGLIRRILDPAGRLVVANDYDGVRRVVAQQFPSGGRARFAYDIASRVTTVTDEASGDVTRYAHDPDGRLVGVIDTTGAALTKSYDEAGNLVAATDRRSAAYATAYDARGNVLSTTDPAGAVRRWSYDAADRMVTATDEGGEVTTYTYAGTSRVPATVTDPTGATTTVEVVDGLVASVTDADGVRTSYGYDSARNVTSTTDGKGATTTYAYDGAGRMTALRSPSGATTTVAYDAVGRVVTETDPTGATSRFAYDPAGKPTAVVDPTGASTTYAYDGAGNLFETRDANGEVTTAAYNANGERVAETRPGGATTTYDYGPLGRLQSVTDPTGAVTRFGFDADGNVVATTDGAGTTRTTTYDEAGRVVAETDPAGATTAYAYDAAGRLVAETDAAGGRTTHAYDPAGRLTATADARGATTQRVYTPAGRLAAVTGPTGATTSFAYDGAGRETTLTSPGGGRTTSSYDADGRLVARTTPTGRTTRYAHDPAGRVVATTAPDGAVTTRAYTARGEVAAEVDPTGARRAFAYDAVGSLIEVVDANGARTRYGYDGRANRTSRTDAAGGVERWGYDLADRLVSAIDPLGRTASYAYDAAGHLVGTADASGRAQSLAYDPAGRLLSRTWADGTAVAYAYDLLGRRTQMSDATGTTTYAYDPVGNLLEVVGPRGERVAYAYDPAGRRSSLTYPDASTVRLTYDVDGRVATASHPTLGTSTHTWDADGRLVGEALPDGGSRAFAYDPAGRLASFDQRLAGADRATTLERDATGRITSESTGGATTTLAYDPAGQLLGAAGSGRTTTYAYDALGRRSTASVNDVEITYSHDAAGQLVSETVAGATRTYTYDGAGRRTGATDPYATVAYAYDTRGLLARTETTAAAGERTVEERAYDGDARLVGLTRTDSTGTTSATELNWDTATRVPEVLTLARDGAATNLVYGERRIGAVRPDGTAALFAVDAHGSTLATSVTADLAAAATYDPYGNPLVTGAGRECGRRPVHPLDPNHCAGDAAGGNPPDVGKSAGRSPSSAPSATALTTARPQLAFGYRGELHVGDLVHLRARDYQPSTGTFTTVDPLEGVAGEVTVANPYHYANNDPLNQIDPLGLSPIRDCDLTVTGETCPPGWSQSTAYLQWLANPPALPVPPRPKTALDRLVERLRIINSVSPDNDWFIRQAARTIGGFTAGRFPVQPGWPGGPTVDDKIPNPIEGRSGWKVELTDNDNNPSRHFVGWLATGYFHPNAAVKQLKLAEAPDRRGRSVQDIRAGLVAIDLGTQLRRGEISRDQLIDSLYGRLGDPNNDGVEVPVPEEPNQPWMCGWFNPVC